MATCLCTTIQQLAEEYDEDKAKEITPALNNLLTSVATLLSKSKSFARNIQYHVTINQHRTMKVRSVRHVDCTDIDLLKERFKDDLQGFWLASEDPVHSELRRRLGCVSIFLRSKLDPQVSIPSQLSNPFQGQNYTELRYAGKKYIKIARKLGGIGAIFWLPYDVPSSTYERYMNTDDEDIFNHLQAIGPESEPYNELARQLIQTQLDDVSLRVPYYNLILDYRDILPDAVQLELLIAALGGSDVPLPLLKRLRTPQRRWSSDGEIESTTATNFGFPVEFVDLMSDDSRVSQAAAGLDLVPGTLEDGVVTWSLQPERASSLQTGLLPDVTENLAIMALKLICFVCPPCYESNSELSLPLKACIWSLLRKAEQKKIPPQLRTPVVEALLYFAERDSVSIRSVAVERAKLALRKSMPYYLHASVALYESFLHRVDGDLGGSDAKIRNFLSRKQPTTSRIDNALRGRLHISQVDNKIKRYDEDAGSSIYSWEGEQPLSSLEARTMFRLQSAVAKYFQSIGDFATARSSLEEYLRLSEARNLEAHTRRLIVARLADACCELSDYGKATEVLRAEYKKMDESEKVGRPYVRLVLAWLEVKLGQGELDAAQAVFEELAKIRPLELDQMANQLLHVRSFTASARIAHERKDWTEALQRWRTALREMEQLSMFNNKHRFFAAAIHISIAHAQLELEHDGAEQSWATGTLILQTERCEFWVPMIATTWLWTVLNSIKELKGWVVDMGST